MNMNFYMPTKVFMGEDIVSKKASEIAALGTKALIVTGRHSAKANGSLQDICKVLEDKQMKYLVYDQVMSNPTIDCVYEGAELAKREGADFVISIGGGSPMDAGKAIALLAAGEVRREDLFSGNYPHQPLPMVHIPTTAGTGSEVTQYAILTNDAAKTKTSIASSTLFPTIALLDPKYMMGLSKRTTIHTAVDAFSHAAEGMLSVRSNVMSDALALESIKILSSCYSSLANGTLSLEERGKLLYASMLAGVVIAHTGTTAVHSMGYSLTYFKDVDHGRANGLLLGSFFESVQRERPELIERILGAMNLTSLKEFNQKMEELLGEPEQITKAELEEYTAIAMKAKNIVNSKVILSEEEIKEVYQKSLRIMY